MVKFCVFYHGKPEDPAAFDKYYWEKHLPLVARWPKLKRIVLSKGQPSEDVYQVAEMYFDSLSDVEAALASPERAVTAEDGKRLPKFNGEVKRRTFEMKDFVVG
jgi:uncharacterized protein (TIGR02118 family)